MGQKAAMLPGDEPLNLQSAFNNRLDAKIFRGEEISRIEHQFPVYNLSQQWFKLTASALANRQDKALRKADPMAPFQPRTTDPLTHGTLNQPL